MSRQQLIQEALRVAVNARHNLLWMERHPDRYDQSKKADMQAYLRKMRRFAKEEIKNARRAGRTSLRNRLKNLIASILAHGRHVVKFRTIRR